MAMVIISLKNVGLKLAGNIGMVEVLHDISLDIERGSSVGVIGPSGSGKSSLLMILAGLEEVSAGSIRILDQDIDQMGEDALARFRRDHMGIVFQSFHLIPTMTALENVATPLELAGAKDALERAADELDAVGLTARSGHFPSQLSGGEQQRVALARAGAGRPDILLADEPTGNLDGSTGETIIDMLFALQERHDTTLILVTHARDLAARCDRIISLRDGGLDTNTAAGVKL